MKAMSKLQPFHLRNHTKFVVLDKSTGKSLPDKTCLCRLEITSENT